MCGTKARNLSEEIQLHFHVLTPVLQWQPVTSQYPSPGSSSNVKTFSGSWPTCPPAGLHVTPGSQRIVWPTVRSVPPRSVPYVERSVSLMCCCDFQRPVWVLVRCELWVLVWKCGCKSDSLYYFHRVRPTGWALGGFPGNCLAKVIKPPQ